MLKKCPRRTTGGKGNLGMFIERDPKICAAGKPSAQPDQTVGDALKHYLLQEEVDALIRDSILIEPFPKPCQLPPLRRPIPRDMRNAGLFSEGSELLRPPIKTKFQTLVDDFKSTVTSSYWKAQTGKGPDPVPYLPVGFDAHGTTLGKKTTDCGRLYDVIMPKESVPEQTPIAKLPGLRTDRNHCKPAYNPDIFFGTRSKLDNSGKLMKCCLREDRVILGTASYKPISTIQENVLREKQSWLGTPLTPMNNINYVPEGFAFGILKPPDNLTECMTHCDLNPERDFFKKCLGHLNSVRKCVRKRFPGEFFKALYLKLKYFDKSGSGWLPKEVVYKYCTSIFIRFDPALIEPLLSAWNAFNGSEIEYKTFCHILNYTHPTPDLPKVPDIPDECVDYRTTYSEMVKLGQDPGPRPMAGLPSGRYFDLDYPITPDRYCKADRSYLPYESDVKACLCPSTLTLMGISHRDMFAARSPELVRKVFESAGYEFTDVQFEHIWNEAKKYHSQGVVCFETFRKVLNQAESQMKHPKDKLFNGK